MREGRKSGSALKLLQLRELSLLFLLGFLPWMFPSPSAASADSPVNVLLIIADDLNCDLGCYGHRIVKTPNLDKLAEESVRFEKAYVQYPICNPTRASFLTGLYPETIRVFNNSDHLRQALPDLVTLPQLFRSGGYFTAAFGKVFHRGVLPDQELEMEDPPSWDLRERGREGERARRGTGRDFPSGSPFGYRWLAAEGDDEDQKDGAIASEAIRFLEGRREGPFFLAVGFHRPHVPLQCPRKYFDLYSLEDFEAPAPSEPSPEAPKALPSDDSESSFASWSDDDRREFLRGYAACVSFMDAQAGRVLDALDRLHLTESTIIVFLGDQGFHLGEQGWWGKNTLFERSLRVPLLVRAPGAKGNGRSCSALVELVDLYPTLAELCALPAPPGLEGKSFRSLLENPAGDGRKAAYSILRRGRSVAGRTVRTERWRYTEWNGGALGTELYDYASDAAEESNLASDPAHSKTKGELAKLLREISPRGSAGMSPTSERGK
jgi:uncharacterized sulfatase